jgi:hypothetical protein
VWLLGASSTSTCQQPLLMVCEVHCRLLRQELLCQHMNVPNATSMAWTCCFYGLDYVVLFWFGLCDCLFLLP